MKKILLPTDFSENAFNAIKYGVQLFKNQESKFYLLNTYTPVLYDSDYFLYNTSSTTSFSLDAVYKRNSLNGLAKVKKRISKEFPNALHDFKKLASFNMLNDEIIKQVEKKNIELVIMGTQGATGTQQILFGTHTVHAIKRTTCPLLAIPSNFEFKKPENILFATDYEINYGSDRLKILKEIAEENNSLIYILHVEYAYGTKPDFEDSKNLLEEYLSGLSHKFSSIQKNTVTEGIYEFQVQNDIDLLVMISNKHTFLQNLLFRPVINEIGFQAKIPFLVIPSGKPNT